MDRPRMTKTVDPQADAFPSRRVSLQLHPRGSAFDTPWHAAQQHRVHEPLGQVERGAGG